MIEKLAVIIALSPMFIMAFYPLYWSIRLEREEKKRIEDLLKKLNGDE